MRNFLKENKFDNIDFIHNNSYEFENCIIVGTRGWNQSEDIEDKKKILKRESFKIRIINTKWNKKFWRK